MTELQELIEKSPNFHRSLKIYILSEDISMPNNFRLKKVNKCHHSISDNQVLSSIRCFFYLLISKSVRMNIWCVRGEPSGGTDQDSSSTEEQQASLTHLRSEFTI